jgi:hypothetical protein
MKKNCWEVKRCGREPGGRNARELGICPAAVEGRTDGVNDGRNGGRACWVIAGTMCAGRVQGSFASKLGTCVGCEFFRVVSAEEGEALQGVKEILRLLQSDPRTDG